MNYVSDEVKALYEERLGRYQAAIALEPVDRIPIAPGSNYFAEVYSGNNNQETVYDPEKWLQAEIKFIQDFPETDVLRDNRIWAPLFDAVDLKTYRLPGRDLEPNIQFQFVEEEYMKADEYDLLIQSPTEFMLERLLPRIFGELNRGTKRTWLAFLKGGIGFMIMNQIMRNRSSVLQFQYGMPQPMTGFFLAPFDVLADVLRGLKGIIRDIYRQPDKVLEACDVLVDEMVNLALATADPLKRYPIFVPTHKACFLSPKQFDTFYWPSFKKTLQKIIDAGYTVRAYLEGNWGPHWHHMLELPKGTVLCDIDMQGDIFQAKKDIGHHQCLAGGIPDSLFVLGTPEDMRQHVRKLCETVGKDGGYIISGACNIPYNTRPENYRAMIDAVLEYGVYDRNLKMRPKEPKAASWDVESFRRKHVVTSWETKKEELGGVLGDEDLIRRNWEQLEQTAYVWLWQWVL